MNTFNQLNSTTDPSTLRIGKDQANMNKWVLLGQRLLVVIVALAVLAGTLVTAPTAHADNCIYSSDGYTALCPGGANYSYLYQYYSRQWNQVATVVFSGNWVALQSGGAVIAMDTATGQTWAATPTVWVNITGMTSTQVNNTLVAYNTSNQIVRHTQVMMGLTAIPDLWP